MKDKKTSTATETVVRLGAETLTPAISKIILPTDVWRGNIGLFMDNRYPPQYGLGFNVITVYYEGGRRPGTTLQ